MSCASRTCRLRTPGDHDVVVRTRFVGINPLDWKLVEGQFRLMAKSRPPCGVGAEFSGEVLRVGAKVSEFRVRAIASPRWLNPFSEPPRALAEQVCVPASQCVRVPRRASISTSPPSCRWPGCRRCSCASMIDVQPDSACWSTVPRAVSAASSCRCCAIAAPPSWRRAARAARRSCDRCSPTRRSTHASPPSIWLGPFDAVIDCASKLDAAALPVLMPAAATSPSRCRHSRA